MTPLKTGEVKIIWTREGRHSLVSWNDRGYIYIYTHTHTYIQIYIHIYIYTYAYIYTHDKYIYIYIYIYQCSVLNLLHPKFVKQWQRTRCSPFLIRSSCDRAQQSIWRGERGQVNADKQKDLRRGLASSTQCEAFLLNISTNHTLSHLGRLYQLFWHFCIGPYNSLGRL